MAFDLSALSQWKEERKGEIIYKPFELDQSLDYFDKVAGVQGQNVLLPVIDSNPTIAIGSAASCGFTDNSQTAITQFSITAPQHKVETAFCLRDLKQYFTSQYLPAKENPDTFEILDEVVGRTILKTSRRMAQIMWIGDTAQAAYPNDFKAQDGILKQLTSVPVGQQNTLASGQTITQTNVLSVIEAVIGTMPTSTLAGGEPVLFVGTDVFRILILALVGKNYFHYKYDYEARPNTFTLKPIVYPGTNVLIVPTLGLNSDTLGATQILNHKQRIVATYRGNLVFGYNVNMDEFDVWYSKDFDQIRMRYAYNAGVGIKFQDLVSEFHLTP